VEFPGITLLLCQIPFGNVIRSNCLAAQKDSSRYASNNFKAFSTISRLLATSFSGRSCGFPVGYGIASAPEIRAAPTVLEIGVTVQI